jgi:ribosomal protein S1
MQNDTVVTTNTDFDWDAYEATCPKFRKKYYKKHGRYPTTGTDSDSALYDALLKSVEELVIPRDKDIVKGTVSNIAGRYAYVDIGWREPAIIDLNKESEKYLDVFSIGSEIEILLKDVRLGTKDGTINASYTEVVKHLKYREIFENIGKPVAFAAHVKELIHGGYFLDIEGVEVFMPGSLGGVNKLVNFESLLGKTIYVVPINYAKDKNYIVVSHRDYLQSLIPQALEDIKPGDGKTGFITGTTKFGVFCEFDGCLTGLIHKSDLDLETKKLFDDRDLKPGTAIDFVIKEIAKGDRIILTQQEFVPEIDPWEDIHDRYQVPSQIQGTIRKKTKYGMFIELEPKVVGLLHVSDIPDYIDMESNREGDIITVDLIKIDSEGKKIFFKI